MIMVTRDEMDRMIAVAQLREMTRFSVRGRKGIKHDLARRFGVARRTLDHWIQTGQISRWQAKRVIEYQRQQRLTALFSRFRD